MRIIMVNNYGYVTGGADLHCIEITQALRERGHEVQWLATSSPDNLEQDGAFIHRTVGADNRDEMSIRQGLGIAAKAMWNSEASRAMKRLVKDFEPDLVHVHKAYVQLSVAPVVIASRMDVPVVQTLHDYEFISASNVDSTGARLDREESQFSYRALNSATYLTRRYVHKPRVRKWIAVSRKVAEFYETVGGIHCEVIPNFGGDPDLEKLSFSDRSGVVFLGRLAEEKGVKYVIEVAERCPEVPFFIAGDGPLRSMVCEADSRLGNLTYKGFANRAEALDLMSRSIACLIPSVWHEPGPLSCLEAMASGTPVVCFPVGGLSEYVSDANGGIVCRIKDTEQLASSVRELASNEIRWQEFSDNGVKASRETHSPERYLNSLEVVYHDSVKA